MATTAASQERHLQPKDIPGRIDPDVIIPASVRAAAARAEAAHKAAYPDQGAPSPQTPAQPPENAPVIPSGGSDESPAGASAKHASQEAPAPTSFQNQQVTPPATTTPTTPSGQAPGGDAPNWEHRYTSMKGRYDKAQDDIKRMGEQITNLQSVLATVQTQPTPPPQVPHELRPENLITPQEVNDYGAEFLDVVGKKAREIATPLVSELQAEIKSLKAQLSNVGGTIAQSARDRMFASLDETLPKWKEINKDPKFLQWLALPDVYSGAIRHNLLKAAWDRNDTARALAFFKGFLAEEAAVDPAAQGQGASQGGNTPPTNGKVPLETFAAPGRAKSAAELPAEKPIIKRSEISKFYADCAAGRYRGNEAEKARLEKMIFDANAEGRIVS